MTLDNGCVFGIKISETLKCQMILRQFIKAVRNQKSMVLINRVYLMLTVVLQQGFEIYKTLRTCHQVNTAMNSITNCV